MLINDLLLDLAGHVLDHVQHGLFRLLPLLALHFDALDALSHFLVDLGE